MTRHFVFATILLAGLTTLLPSAWAEKVYTVGVEAQDYAPFSYVKDGQFQGLIRDVLDEFAASKGYRFEYEPYPIPRLFRAFLEEKVDFKFPDHPDWAKSQKQDYDIHYSRTGIPAINGVMTLDGNEVAEPEELKRIGTVLGFTIPELQALAEQGTIELYEVNKLENLLKMLRRNHVKGIYFDSNVARHYMKKQTSATLQLNKNFPFTLFEYRMSSLLHPNITREFDQFLQQNQTWFLKRLEHYGIQQQ